MNLNSSQVACVSLKSDIHVPLERLAKARFDPILFNMWERCRGGNGDLLSPLRLIDQLREGLCDFRQKPDTVFLHQLVDEGLPCRGTSKTSTKFRQNGNFAFDAESG